MMKVNVISVLIMINFYLNISGAQSLGTNAAAIDFGMVQQLSKQIGEKLLNISEAVTKRNEVQDSFMHAKVVTKNGRKIVEEIAKDLEMMLDIRIKAVKKIVQSIQNLPKVHENDTFFTNYTFINIRERDKHGAEILAEKEEENLRKEKASQDPNYKKKRKPNNDGSICIPSVSVGSSKSNNDDDEEDGDDDDTISFIDEAVNVRSKEAGVFLPLDVYDKEEPTIGWQYFCNSSGVFRHFPVTNWTFYPMNTFDCRMRPWFTNAASSSKDIVVLIEQSGSMTGERLSIAKDVVRNILNTLTINDYVNVFSFNDEFRPIIDCKDDFCKDTLIQATPANIFELKQALDSIEAKGQTDLLEALNHTFHLLHSKRESSSHCNKVIMLITDGMEYNTTIRKVFEEENWEKNNEVRVFSYLIGEMIPQHDFKQVKSMACENRGYYVQIDTIKETREQVLRYIPVMARPLAFNKTQNPIIFTSVYADLLDTYRVTNYDWNCKQRATQRQRVVDYLKKYQKYSCIADNEDDDDKSGFRKYLFMTTVAMPAFEQDKNSSQLMGVAGVDVPLYEFERLFQQFRLGVHSYAFILDENGNILTHPDFRPFFQNELLKPSYNSIDMVEVELIDADRFCRDFHPELLSMRRAMITNDKTTGSKVLPILQHFDDLRRVMKFKRHYYWKKIDKTPFTVVVTFSDDAPNQVQIPEHEVDSMTTKGSKNLKYFQGNYRLHPNWIYCRSLKKSFEDMKLGEIDPDNCEMTPEEELEYFLEKFEKNGWKWRTSKNDKGAYKCDQKLMQALLYDAKVTQNYPHEPTKSNNKKDKNSNIFEEYEISTSFIATHSGLLRYKIFSKDEDDDEINQRSDEFGDEFKKSIDEDWYKHTTYFNKHEPKSFIYKLPFNANKESLITATTTIYARDGTERAPVAVLGYQFPHAKFAKLLDSDLCAMNAEQVCFILDDYAYVIADSREEQEGKFFGDVDKKLMKILIHDNIYEKKQIYDFQGVCYQDREIEYEYIMEIVSNAGSILLWNPLKNLWMALIALFTTIGKFFETEAVAKKFVPNLMYPDPDYYYEDDSTAYCPYADDGSFDKCLKENDVKKSDKENEKYIQCEKNYTQAYKVCHNSLQWSTNLLKRHTNKTRPIKCDKNNFVYVLNLDESNLRKPYNKCERPFIVQRIPNSNLILLVTKSDCDKNVNVEPFNIQPKTIGIEDYQMSLFCYKLRNPLYRRHSKSCINYHANEPIERGKNTSLCGRGNRLEMKFKFLLISPVILIMLKFL
ncbi:hypothetical protein PVAND_006378 [Polypedilum vanderplanki]|uniref:VWFA domain-containing protein n=1 Tax=Polypedilum vanderplanki TaxID=319348 RepID=A0A9J6C310_POLVA|nr:hypothetical protein PVAND_006378 [Polypedilum vanderplanki]